MENDGHQGGKQGGRNWKTGIDIFTLLGFPDGMGERPSAKAEKPARSLGREDPLEKETATHPSIPAWRIPSTEEPGALQSVGLCGVRHK